MKNAEHDQAQRNFLIEGVYYLACKSTESLDNAYKLYPELRSMNEEELITAVVQLRAQLLQGSIAVVDTHLAKVARDHS